MPAPSDYRNAYLKKPPKRLAVVDQNSCSGCAGSPVCVTYCETVTVKDEVVDAIRYVRSPDAPNNLAIIEPHKCIGCSLCVEVCPWDAIRMYNFDEAWDAAEQVTHVAYSRELDANPKPEGAGAAGDAAAAGAPPAPAR